MVFLIINKIYRFPKPLIFYISLCRCVLWLLFLLKGARQFLYKNNSILNENNSICKL